MKNKVLNNGKKLSLLIHFFLRSFPIPISTHILQFPQILYPFLDIITMLKSPPISILMIHMPHNPNTMTMSKTTKTPSTTTIIPTRTLTRWTIFTTASLLIFYVTFNRRCRCGMIGLFSCLKLDGWLFFLWVFWAVVDVYCAVAVDCVDEILVWWVTKFCMVLFGLGVVYVGYVWRNGFYLDGLDPFNSLVYVYSAWFSFIDIFLL